MADDLTVIVVALLGGKALDQCVQAVRAQCETVLAVQRDGSIVDGKDLTVGMAERLAKYSEDSTTEADQYEADYQKKLSDR